jgi:branched-chain amino acid transport system permease protein
MGQYLIAGLVLGGLYAIIAVSLSMTYVSAGVLNFAFGAEAYFVARIYYYLHSQIGWPIVAAAVVSICLIGPALGFVLWAVLFRALKRASSIVKIAATIGLSVMIPAVVALIFGNTDIVSAPGLAPEPVHVVHVFGTPVTLDQILVLAFVLALGIIGVLVLRYTDVGLRVRATVDSEAMTSLFGTNPSVVSAIVWIVTTGLAGLIGVLVAPILGLQANEFTLIMAVSFGAVVVAQFRRFGVAAIVGLAFGLATGLADWRLPSDSTWTAAATASIPFIFMAVALLYFWRRRGGATELNRSGLLDAAIAVSDNEGVAQRLARERVVVPRSGERQPLIQITAGRTGRIVLVLVLLALPLLARGLWVGLVAEGIIFAIVFLAVTVVTGEGGMVWLCMISFTGLGALFTAQLNNVYRWPVLLGIVLSAVVVGVLGLIVGLAVARFGGLYTALATLTFGFLVESLVYPVQRFDNFGAGVVVSWPSFITSDRAFAYAAIIVFLLVAAGIAKLRRSTAGLALAAARTSEIGSSAIGINVGWLRVLISGLAALIAGLGGGLLASYSQVALPTTYATLTGLVWFAVIVTAGLRSTPAALVAGLSYTLIPGLFLVYLPLAWSSVPSALFGLGAIMVLKDPDGAVAVNVRLAKTTFRRGWALVKRTRTAGPAKGPGPGDELAVEPLPSPADPGQGIAEFRAVQPVSAAPVVRAPASRQEKALEAQQVSVRFGGVQALRAVDMTVPLGAIVGLIGPNGAGKTTLFGVLSGVIRPAEGRIILNGTDVSRRSPVWRARAGLGRTFQHPELFSELTIRDHFVLADRMSRARGRLWTDLVVPVRVGDIADQEARRADALVDMLGLHDVQYMSAVGLPLGLTRLVEVGRALALDPKVVLLDEPSAGLDSNETSRLCSALETVQAAKGISMVIVEHDLSVVSRLAELVYVLDFGELIASGTAEGVAANERVRTSYLGHEGVDAAKGDA